MHKKEKIVHTKYKKKKSRIKILKKERKITLNKKENKISKEIRINKKSARRSYSNQTGITLIALVVTIVVLLILAGVSINALFGDSGIIQKAQDAQNKMDQAAQNDLDAINSLNEWLDNKTNGSTGENTTGDDTPTEKPLITDSSLTSNDRTTSESTTVIAKDKKGNQVVVPGGFKISSASGETVQQGIVIEDKEGNQFVWVPVSNINGDGSNKIVKDDGSEVEITLGRYTFATSSPGTPTPIQKGSEYAQTTIAQATAGTLDTKYGVAQSNYYFYELNGSRTGKESSGTDGTNTTAKNLKDFIEKTKANKGFYIARYEASYGSGYNSSGTDTTTKFSNAKPLSKPSTANSTSSMNYNNSGTLWNYIRQPQAALVSQNMYKNDKYVESDLINSYAWDTAIVYIQAMGNANYANQTDGNGTLKNTGSTGDEKCKIFDMAGNAREWTTEYSTNTISSSACPCTDRGGYCYDSNFYTSNRGRYNATVSSSTISFRPLLYVK